NMEPPPPAAPAGKGAPQTNAPGWMGKLPIDQKLVIPVAAVAGLLLLIFIAVVVLLLRSRKKSRKADAQPALAAGRDANAIDDGNSPAAQMEAKIAERVNQQRLAEAEAINALKLPPVATKKAEVLTKHLRENIKKEPAVAAQVLLGWVRDE